MPPMPARAEGSAQMAIMGVEVVGVVLTLLLRLDARVVLQKHDLPA